MSVMNQQIMWLSGFGIHFTPWKIIGFTGALMFGGRWLVQFVASRRYGKPVIPRLFWYMSLVGIADLRGVAWLIRRGKVTRVEELP